MLLADRDPPLGIAHFTVIDMPPPELVELAARIGYACIGLRLHPAFPGAPFYEIPSGSAAMRQMKQRLGDTGIVVYDIEFVTVGAGFVAADLTVMLASAAELGAKCLSVCGDDPDPGRQVASFAALCELAAGFGMGVDLECMAWRQVASLPAAIRVVEAAGRPNGGALVDAIHLSRTGGAPADLTDVPPQYIRSAQLCDALSQRPATNEAIIQEARSGRLPPVKANCPCANYWRPCRRTLPSASRCLWTAASRPRCMRSGSSTRPGSCSIGTGNFNRTPDRSGGTMS